MFCDLMARNILQFYVSFWCYLFDCMKLVGLVENLALRYCDISRMFEIKCSETRKKGQTNIQGSKNKLREKMSAIQKALYRLLTLKSTGIECKV